jgi:hypothetical protein
MVDFESGCPVALCSNSKSLLTWHHHKCGATETIDSEGIVKCRKGHNLGEFFLLRYNCEGHNNGFQYGSYSAFLAALSICSNFGSEFAFKLTGKLMDAYQNGRLPKN